MSTLTTRKRTNRVLQVPPIVPYKALGKFSKALYGTTEGTCSSRFFRRVMLNYGRMWSGTVMFVAFPSP